MFTFEPFARVSSEAETDNYAQTPASLVYWDMPPWSKKQLAMHAYVYGNEVRRDTFGWIVWISTHDYVLAYLLLFPLPLSAPSVWCLLFLPSLCQNSCFSLFSLSAFFSIFSANFLL